MSSSSSALFSSSHLRGIATSPSLPCLRSYHASTTSTPADINTSKPMNSPLQAIASPPPPNHLQHHLYDSFLHRKTADVAIRVRGSWHAIYRLHRVVLIQAVSILFLCLSHDSSPFPCFISLLLRVGHF